MKREYKIDPAHSSAHFTVRRIMIANVRGASIGIQRRVIYHPEDMKASALNVVIDASTVNTLEARREPSAEGKDPWGNLRMGASATTRIKRGDFGLAWNQALETGKILVGDELKLAIDVSLTRAERPGRLS